jgi:hypothetical protein
MKCGWCWHGIWNLVGFGHFGQFGHFAMCFLCRNVPEAYIAGAAAFKAHLAAQKKKERMPSMLENCWKAS